MKDLIDSLIVIKAQAGENAVVQGLCDVVIELIERTASVEPASEDSIEEE